MTLLWGSSKFAQLYKLSLVISERGERAQSCCVQLRFQIRSYIYIYVCGRTSSYVCACSVVRTVGGV